MSAADRQSPWQNELHDLLRGVAGAFLFGAPFLYTMEMWWKGNFTTPPRMLVALGLTYVSLIGLNRAAGFRVKEKSTTWIRTLADSAEALAIGLTAAALSLVLIGVIGPRDGLDAIMGRIVMEGMPFGIGVGIANNFLQLNEGNDSNGGDAKKPSDRQKRQRNDHSWHGTLADAGVTALGATIIASSISPTDEIPMIASGLTLPWLLAVIAASLLLSYIIVFEANFGSQKSRVEQPGIFQTPISETMISYLISLAMSFMMLWLFQLLRVEDPLAQWVSYTIVLGLPATIGGAAGRLAL
jgi:putative integral membrane protein (TIGR02587 family)